MTSTISTLNLYGAMRMPIQTLQSEISQTQQEISSGRIADPGLTLGANAAISVGLRNEDSNLQALIGANQSVTARLNATQSALTSLTSVGQNLQQQLLGAGNAPDASAIASSAQATLGQIISTLNTTFNGQYIFGGVQSGVQPVANYTSTPPSAGQASVAQAFKTAFGTTQGSPASAKISAQSMQSFLNTQFSSLFDDTNWKANWSQASDTTIQSQISPSQTVASSISANQAGFRDLVQAATMVSDTGLNALGGAAQAAVMNTASALIGKALGELTNVSANVGLTLNQTSAANDIMTTQSTYLQTQIGDYENADPAAASIRLTTLTTQLQSSYSVTSQLSQLSLVKFL